MTKQGNIIVGVKQVAKDHFAWPGGYPLMVILSDGECLCAKCTEENLRLIVSATAKRDDAQWEAIGQDVNWEDEELICANCYKLIESAYGNS